MSPGGAPRAAASGASREGDDLGTVWVAG